MFRPWLDPLGDEFRLLYVDERGQGRSDRVDPATLSLEVFARDVDLLAEALGLDEFALLGHSFGAIIATWHATELGTAAAYVISGGAESSDALMADVDGVVRDARRRRQAPSRRRGSGRRPSRPRRRRASCSRTSCRSTSTASRRPAFRRRHVYSPDVLRHFANAGYGDFDYRAGARRRHAADARRRRRARSHDDAARRTRAPRGHSRQRARGHRRLQAT